MSETSRRAAMDFMENEKQFHLGFLPTEQSNPMTKNLDKEFAAATTRGVSNLQSVDRKVLEMAKKVFASKEFAKLTSDAYDTIMNGGKIVFSGCGATGRLSILLECMWRTACVKDASLAKYANHVFSIMTGGDYALVRSVEFFEDYQSSYGYELGDSKWKDVVKKGDMTWAEQRLRSGEWFIFMIGIDSEGELTGYYQKLELTIEQEVATDAYNRWLGTWQVINGDGTSSFQIDILPSANNMWYYMSGWESDNVYQYDTTDPALMPEVYFDKETGEMCFISQYLNTLVDDAGSYDFYFSGTFTYGNTYVLGSEVLNYRMADAGFVDTTYKSARIEACDFVTQGMSFPIESICYMYSVAGQLGAISLAPPTLPLTLTKIN